MSGQAAGPTAGTDVAAIRQFFQEAGDQPASAVLRTAANFQITVGSRTLPAAAAELETALETGIVDPDCLLMQSILVYEAALNARLRQGTARGILQAFAAATAAGTVPEQARRDAYWHIALACDVEAYLNHKNGLATDIRQVGSFTEDALTAASAGLSDQTDGAVDPAVVDRIMAHQQALDHALNTFMDAVAEAQATGTYTTAFDAQQRFFQITADLIETDYWRTRATNWSKAVGLAETMANIAFAKTVPSRLAEAATRRPQPDS